MQHPESKVSPIPLAEMIRSDQKILKSHISFRSSATMSKVLNKSITLTHVEVDYSWPMLHIAFEFPGSGSRDPDIFSTEIKYL